MKGVRGLKIKYNYEDYLFVSSRIRAMETSLLSRETVSSMIEARNLTELYGILEDNGIAYTVGKFGEKSFESGLKERLSVAYLDILGSVPSPELFTVFTYPYDCNNLKTAIKAAEKGVSPDLYLLPYGTVSPEAVKETVLKRKFSVFPTNMAKATEKAIEVFAKTRNPQEIDLVLDKALFLDMKSSVAENPIELFHELLKIKADTVNILSYIRVAKMGGDFSLFERAFAPGGEIGLYLFEEAFKNGPEALMKELTGRYERFSAVLSDKEISLSGAEKVADRIYSEFIKTAREVQSGAGVVAGYIAAIENEVKSIRILIAGKRLSVNSEEFFERLSESYV